MTRINVYYDGKLSRGMPATIIKAKGKRILIQFHNEWSDDEEEDTDTSVWFNKVSRSRKGVYTHAPTNTWFYRERETEAFKFASREWLVQEYYDKLFNPCLEKNLVGRYEVATVSEDIGRAIRTPSEITGVYNG